MEWEASLVSCMWVKSISNPLNTHALICLRSQDYAKETSYFASYIELTPEMNVSAAAAASRAGGAQRTVAVQSSPWGPGFPAPTFPGCLIADRVQHVCDILQWADAANLCLQQGMNVGIGPIKPWILHPDRSFDGVHDSPITKFEHRTNDIFG